MIVDFAIEDDDHRPVFTRHWLLAMLDIDDRQPSMPERDLVVHPGTEVVGAAVAHAVTHATDQVRICPSHVTDDPAHALAPVLVQSADGITRADQGCR